MPKVLVVATSRKTRGGITSVIKAHETGRQWKDYHCYWIQTHRDGNAITKLLYLFSSLLDYVIRLPFYDIVHIHFSQPASAKRKLPFAWLAKKLGKKIIMHFHAFDIETTINGVGRNIYRNLFSKADRIVVLSNWWKQQMINTFPDSCNKLSILYNPCPTTNKVDCKKTETIIYAGTVNQRKGYADLINAFANISTSHPTWKLVIAGNGEIDKAKCQARNLNIDDKVIFPGWIDGIVKATYFSEASIFCLPSYAEGFPMAVLDAWAYGLPVVTTPVGGIPDIAKDGENILLFEPGNVDMLSQKLESLMDSTALMDSLSKASTTLSQTTFNINFINKQLKNLYHSLI